MQLGFLPKWRNVLILRSASAVHSSSTQFASFHFKPASRDKSKSRWNSEVKREQKPPKNHIRYETHEKRADTKKALKDLLYKSGCSRVLFEHEEPKSKAKGTRYPDEEQPCHSRSFDKNAQSRSAARRAKRAHYKRRKLRRECFPEDFDDDDPETVFEAKFGKRSFTWSFKSWGESSSQSSTDGFEWKEQQSNWKYKRYEWETSSDTDSGNESCIVGSYSDRITLGLPPRGPLKLEDIKTAFRSSALKWHPDKHQGPSQAMANEKFKLCVDAYKSLCNAFPSA